jgi:hypothetical protein
VLRREVAGQLEKIFEEFGYPKIFHRSESTSFHVATCASDGNSDNGKEFNNSDLTKACRESICAMSFSYSGAESV